MTLVRTLVLGFGLVAAAAAADDAKPADKLTPEALVGKWALTAGTKDGAKMDKADGDVTFTKDKIAMKGPDGSMFEFSYKLDPKAAPAAVDLEILAPEGFKGAKAKGIVAVEKDVLKIAYHPMEGDRPKDFAAKKGSGEFSFELKKAEKK